MAAAAAGVGLAVSSCTTGGGGGGDAVPLLSPTSEPRTVATPAPCAGLRSGPGPAAGGLPDVRLDCLGSGPAVSVGRLRGPLVVNVWATWCQSCVTELPVLAQYARSRGSVPVLGVDYEERGTSAQREAVVELSRAGVRYPSVVDGHGEVAAAGVPLVPTTFFLDATGRVVFRRIEAFTGVDSVRADVATHLGVPAS